MNEQQWRPTEQTQEAGSNSTGVPPAQTALNENQAAMIKLDALYKNIKGSGNWFYWIAGLSLINTIIAASHGGVAFLVGLGFTQIFDALISEYGGIFTAIGIPINLGVTAIYAAFGYFACRRARWAFIAGMVIYGLDSLLVLIFQNWFGLAFHIFAIYAIFGGLKADTQARNIEANMARPV